MASSPEAVGGGAVSVGVSLGVGVPVGVGVSVSVGVLVLVGGMGVLVGGRSVGDGWGVGLETGTLEGVFDGCKLTAVEPQALTNRQASNPRITQGRYLLIEGCMNVLKIESLEELG